MDTQCSAAQLEFHGLGGRAVVGEFDGGKISSDAGGVLLREVEKRTHILKRLAGCFVDHRDGDQIEHALESLIKQRVMGLALGYEDLNDHGTLRHDPLLALLSDQQDLSGKTRKRDQDKGKKHRDLGSTDPKCVTQCRSFGEHMRQLENSKSAQKPKHSNDG